AGPGGACGHGRRDCPAGRLCRLPGRGFDHAVGLRLAGAVEDAYRSGMNDTTRLGDLSGIRGRLTLNAALAPFTWFRVGGPAEFLFQPADEEDLALFLQKLDPGVPVNVFGVGSNLLVRDGGVRGVVIRLSAKGFGQAERADGPRIRAGAALPDKRVAAFALEQGLGGFAFFHGIPGTVGGALRMNAGANGAETQERMVEAVGIDRQGRRRLFTNADMGFTY